MIALLLQGATLGLSAASLPGPFQAFLLGQTLSFGWRRTLPLIFAPLLSDAPIILAFVLFLARMPNWFLGVVQILGGSLLVYLGIEAVRTVRSGPTSRRAPTGASSLLKAALINLTGPGPYLFWGLVGAPILISSWQNRAVLGVAFLLGFYLMLIGGFGILVAIFALAGRLKPSANRLLVGLSVVILIYFSAQLFIQGTSRLLEVL